MIIKTIKEKAKEEFVLLKKHYKDKTGNSFYLKHDKQLTETIFNEGRSISISQTKALVETIESLEAQGIYPTLYNHCKEILNTFHKLKKYQTFNF